MDLFPDFMLGSKGIVGGGSPGRGSGGSGGGGYFDGDRNRKRPIIKVTAFSTNEDEEKVRIKLKEVRNGVQGVLYEDV